MRFGGQALAEEALRVFRRREATYPAGITVAELEYELRLVGSSVAGGGHLERGSRESLRPSRRSCADPPFGLDP